MELGTAEVSLLYQSISGKIRRRDYGFIWYEDIPLLEKLQMMDVLDVHHLFERIDFSDVTILRIVDVDMTIPADEVNA